jgi:hypothetical protein
LSLESLENRTLPSVSFAPAVSLPVGLRPEHVVTADLGNGHQDIVVLNQGQAPNNISSVSVLLGNGDGTFQPAITTGVPAGATNLAVGDFHGDGKLDLAIVNAQNNSFEILRGNGDGTFQSDPFFIGAGTGLAVGDFAHNGKLDLAVTQPLDNTVSVLLGNGDGTFQNRVDLPVGTVGTFAVSVVAADLGNGQLDLVVANSAPFVGRGTPSVSVLRGNGDGSFQPAQNIDVNSHIFGVTPDTVAVGDLNGDGKPAIVVGQEDGDAFHVVVTVLPGNGDGTFRAPIHTDLGFDRVGLAVADLNGDGKLDIATLDERTEGFGVDVFPGNGDGTFGGRTAFLSGGEDPFGIAVGDVKGDGRPDLVVANTFSNTVAVLLNTSTAATATSLNADVNPAVVGQTVNLTATVTRATGIPTGSLTFMDGATVLGTATLDNTGTATLAVAFPTAGDHAVTAVYSGQGFSAASTSDVLTETVTPAATAVVLTPSVDQGQAGVPVSFTVTVSPVAPGAGVPTGTVTILDGTTVLGTAQLDANGQAIFTFAFDAGDQRLSVSYGGDDNFQNVISDPLDMPVI